MSDVPVNIATPFQATQKIRNELKRNVGSIFITGANTAECMSKIPHNVFYADGEVRFIENAGNWDMIVFHRTVGNAPDSGEWLTVATTSGAVTW
jgi:hypothetical protein